MPATPQSVTACRPGGSQGARSLSLLAVLVATSLAILWGFAGLSKSWDIALNTLGDPSSLLGGVRAERDTDWASTFPGALVLLVCTAELLAAWWILTDRAVAGLKLGAALLAVILLALLIWPIPAGTSCGCIGGGGDLPGSPGARVGMLGGMHAFALAFFARGVR